MATALKLCIALLFVLTLSRAEPGFFTTNPEQGTLNYVSASQPSYIFHNTHLSHPTSIGISNQTGEVFFSNAAPSLLPWIAKTSFVETLQNTKVVSSSQDTFSASTISGVTIDETNNRLFYFYSNVPASNIYSDFPLIQSVSASEYDNIQTVLKFSTMDGNYVPTSIALDTKEQFVYFTTNGLFVEDSETGTLKTSGAGIYRIDYDGDNLVRLQSLDKPLVEFKSIGHIQLNSKSQTLYFLKHNLDYSSSSLWKFALELDEAPTEVTLGDKVPRDIYIPPNSDNVFLLLTTGQVVKTDDLESPVANLLDGSLAWDFVVEEISMKIFYVGPNILGVRSTSFESEEKNTVLSIGLGDTSKIWFDSSKNIVYYSTLNVIESLELSTSTWAVVGHYDEYVNIKSLNGENETLLVTFSNTKGIFSINTTTPTAVNTFYGENEVSALTVSAGLVYFAFGEDIYSCPLSNCASLSHIVRTSASVISLTVGVNELRTVYYSTANSTFGVHTDKTPSVPHGLNEVIANIRPFGLTLINDTLYFLDSSNSKLTLYKSQFPGNNTIDSIFVLEGVTDIQPGGNAWITYDSQNHTLYWTATPLQGVIYQTPLESELDSTPLPLSGNGLITGLSFSQTQKALYVSRGSEISIVSQEGPSSNCSVSFEPRSKSFVGVTAISGANLLWADLVSGHLYECTADCNACETSSSLDDSDVRNSCARLQFVAISEQTGAVYSQVNCGGIHKLIRGESSNSLQIIKNPDGKPISSLVVHEGTTLVWALPFENSIDFGTDADGLNDVKSFYSGTGVYTNLFVDDRTSPVTYWVNSDSQRLMHISENSEVVANSYVSSVGAFVFTSVAPSPISEPTPLPSPSPSASASASPSPSLSTLPTISRQGIITRSSSPTASVSVSENENSSVTVSGSVSGSVSVSASVSGSVSATASVSASSNSVSSPSRSGPSESSSVTPSISISWNGSPSNTPGIANIGNYTQSPLITSTGWEWIIVISVIVVICCIIPISLFCWKRGVESEMALSLRLPDGDDF